LADGKSKEMKREKEELEDAIQSLKVQMRDTNLITKFNILGSQRASLF